MKSIAYLFSACVFGLIGAPATAADCDQNGTPPQHSGAGPVFSGRSGVFQPVGGAHVKQWICYFPATARVLSVAPNLFDSRGKLATYAIYDVGYNYDRAGFTEIKLSWTTAARKPIPAEELTLDFTVTFEAAPLQ